MKAILRNSSLVFETAKTLVNYLDPTAVRNGIYNGNGTIGFTNQYVYFCSDFIPVQEEGLIWTPEHMPATTTFTSYTVFDANKNYIRDVKFNETDYNKYTYQSGDAYIVVNLYKNGLTDIAGCQTEAATRCVVSGDEYQFVPYVPSERHT